MRVTRQVKEGGTEKTGGGVTAREENVQHVIAQHLRVIGIGSQSIEEDVSATLVLLLGVSLRVQRDADVVVHDFVDASVRVTEFLRVDQPVQSLGSGARSQIVLGSGESLAKPCALPTSHFSRTPVVSDGGSMQPTDSPKRKCVAESRVNRKNSRWISKALRSLGIKSSRWLM